MSEIRKFLIYFFAGFTGFVLAQITVYAINGEDSLPFDAFILPFMLAIAIAFSSLRGKKE